MGTAVGGVSRAESRTESEIAAPVIEVCTNFIGRGKPLPYIDSVVYLLIRCLRHHLPGHGKAAVIRRSVNGREVKDKLC